jgi:tetratricopeptide (TPR) repeat protein
LSLLVSGCAVPPDTATAEDRNEHLRTVSFYYQSNLGPQGTIVDYNSTIESYPQSFNAYLNRGGVKQAKGDFDGAIADYDKAIELDPNYACHIYFRRGLAKVRKGDFDGAITDFDATIGSYPNDAIAYCDRGNAKVHKNDLDGAVADYDRALEIKPDFALAYRDLGGVADIRGEFDEAVIEYEKAIAFSKSEEEAAYPRFRRNLAVRRLHPSGLNDQAAENARAELGQAVAGWKESWPKTVGLYLTGHLAEADFLAQAGQGDAKTVRLRQCEAFYYAGMVHRERASGRAKLFRKVYRHKSDEFRRVSPGPCRAGPFGRQN